MKKDLRHELYKQCLDEHKEMKHKQIVIRSRGHQMGVYEQNKTSLSPLDTKKWIAADGITTRAYGHYLTAAEDNAAIEKLINELWGVRTPSGGSSVPCGTISSSSRTNLREGPSLR